MQEAFHQGEISKQDVIDWVVFYSSHCINIHLYMYHRTQSTATLTATSRETLARGVATGVAVKKTSLNAVQRFTYVHFSLLNASD